MDTPTLTDGIVTLDALQDVDAAAFAGLDDPTIRQAFGANPAGQMSNEGAAALIAKWSASWADAGAYRAFAVRVGGELSGVAVAKIKQDTIAILEIRVGSIHRRAKVAARAVRLLADFVVDGLSCDRLRLDIYDWNEPAQRLAEWLGFKPIDSQGLGLPGWTFYGLTDDEWRELSPGLAERLEQPGH